MTLLVFVFYFAAPASVKSFVTDIDESIQDLMFRFRGPERSPARRDMFDVVIVDIDERSLKELGQFPWPRYLVADLLKKLDTCEPKAIGLDMIFAEPDRTSLKNQLPHICKVVGVDAEFPDPLEDMTGEEMRPILEQVLGAKISLSDEQLEKLDNDQLLADVVENSEHIVLGYLFLYEDDGLKDSEYPAVPYGSGNYLPVKSSPDAMEDSPFAAFSRIPYRSLISIPLLDDAAEDRCGFFNVSLDEAGKVRLVTLLTEYEKSIYGSLSAQMLRVGLGESSVKVHIDGIGVTGLEFQHSDFVNTDNTGRVYVNYYGPSRTFRYVSAVDIIKNTDKFNPEWFKDKYVIVGTSASGLMDLRVNPFDATYPGMEVHATVIENILKGDIISKQPWFVGIEAGLILAFGFAMSLALGFTRPLFGTLLAFISLAFLVDSAFRGMFADHVLMPVAFPILSMVLVFMTVTMFNYFFEGKQKRFIKGAFGTYLSPLVVEKLIDDPKKLSLVGERKDLTVFFSDIAGFTSISEKLSPEELSHLLNEYLTPMADIVMDSRGCVDKFIGDAVMAFWGAPLDDDDNAINAARAALAMQEKLVELRRGWDARGLDPIHVRIGLNSGPVSVGNMGSKKLMNYTVMGDNVNLASRLEGINKAYGTSIIVSEYTREKLGPGFFCRLLDIVRVKGKSQPVKIYELICEGSPSGAKRSEVEKFEKAFELYRNRNFEETEKILNDLEKINSMLLYREYLSRIEHFKFNPPPEYWDGVYTFTHK